MRLCIVIVNHRTAGLVVDALASLDGQVDPVTDQVIVVDNDSRDDSIAKIEGAIASRGFGAWCSLVRAGRNLGLAGGLNAGIRAADADFYLWMRGDVRVRPGALASLLSEMKAHTAIGLIGPRIESPDGVAVVSCFRDLSPVSELLDAAGLPLLTEVFHRYRVPQPLSEDPSDPDWLSFACVLVRREVIEKVGLLDEAYFSHFVDSDYCRAARGAGFRVRYFPGARVTQLAAGAATHALSLRERAPGSFYASRGRYFRKGYGPAGPWIANAAWQIGRSISLALELAGRKTPHTREREWLDNWKGIFGLSLPTP